VDERQARFHALTLAAEREGLGLYARFSPKIFRAASHGPARALSDSLGGGADAERALAAYLRLLAEAVGLELLGEAELAEPKTLLAFFLARLIPARLAAHPPEERLPLLVRLWNLGEAVAREPAWIGRYLAALAAGVSDLGAVDAFLADALAPALTPSPPAAFRGPFALAVLDPRPLAEEFLPGEMHLVAPAVLCVHDLRAAGVALGVLLKRERQSRLIGPTACLGEPVAEAALPEVRLGESRAEIAGRAVALPLLGHPAKTAVARAGFLVASAHDSQRLWVVESP
jgi:hypothetical protein